MADETTAGPNGAEGMAEEEGEAMGPPILIGAQYIKDLSFENPQGHETLAALSQSPEVNVEVKTGSRELAEDAYEVSLFIRGEARVGDTSVFIVELTYAGIVQVNNLPAEAKRPIVLIEGPRHLFPFARNVVAGVVRDGGFPPLMINPLDFAQLYMEQHGTPEEIAALQNMQL